jgi:hypothetical protein
MRILQNSLPRDRLIETEINAERRYTRAANASLVHGQRQFVGGTAVRQCDNKLHRANLDVAHGILKGDEKYISRQHQAGSSQYVSSYFQCTHDAFLQ